MTDCSEESGALADEQSERPQHLGLLKAGQGRPAKVLIAYSMVSTFTSTTLDYLLALKHFSSYHVEYAHVTHGAIMNFDINEYDVVVNNYCARFPFEGYVSKDYEENLLKFRGLKIIAVQDDYDFTATLHRAIRRLGFHVLLTCIQPEFWHLAYPKSELPGVKIIQGLTGYMPERLVNDHPPIVPLPERKFWLAYRGRQISARYGRLGFDKEEIGRRMIEICDARQIPHDIAMDDNSRIYGNAWFEFLGSSRAMLGSESGCNVFDFDGDLDRFVAGLTAKNGRPPRYDELVDVLDPLERYFNVGQISPRVFECALMRTPMVLFRGSYSGAIEADRHYIPLERDFSNVDDVIAKLEDLELLQGVADRAYEQLVASGRFGYRSLAELLSRTIEEEYPVRFDPVWDAYRAETSQPWRPHVLIEQAETEEQARQMAFMETPTAMPLSPADYKAREERFLREYDQMVQRRLLAEAERLAEVRQLEEAGLMAEAASLAEQGGGSGSAAVPRPRSRARLFVRRLWRLLPERLRFKIARMIQNAMS